MAAEPIILVVNSNNTNKTYAFYRHGIGLATIRVADVGKKLHMYLTVDGKSEDIQLHDVTLESSLEVVLQVCLEKNLLGNGVSIDAVALKVAVPSAHFLSDRILTDHELSLLDALHAITPYCINKLLNEIREVRAALPQVSIVCVSDSAFHATKPDYTWNYGIHLQDADAFDIKRFGYNGIAVASVIKQIKASKFAPLSKVVVCNLGSNASVTAVYNGKSIDTTTGYSPNEGLIASTHSGTIEFSAALALAKHKKMKPDELVTELNTKAGLKGISGTSDDIETLLQLEAQGNHRAELALCMYVYSVRQAIARMIASLEGIDMLVFTGTEGGTSATIRARILRGLEYLGIVASPTVNKKINAPHELVAIHPRTRSKAVLVVPVQEEKYMAARARKLLV